MGQKIGGRCINGVQHCHLTESHHNEKQGLSSQPVETDQPQVLVTAPVTRPGRWATPPCQTIENIDLAASCGSCS